MLISCYRTVAAAALCGAVAAGWSQTYGNTTPFETQSSHSPNFVLGVQVSIPVPFTVLSFGMMYGHPGSSPSTSNAKFSLYDSNGTGGTPGALVAQTGVINLSLQQTYDNIAFTSTPFIAAGTYWMMGFYQSMASPRMGLTDPNSLVAYWSQNFTDPLPGTAPTSSTYTGQNFNYWVNGTAVPEPATFAVFGLGVLAVAMMRRRR